MSENKNTGPDVPDENEVKEVTPEVTLNTESSNDEVESLDINETKEIISEVPDEKESSLETEEVKPKLPVTPSEPTSIEKKQGPDVNTLNQDEADKIVSNGIGTVPIDNAKKKSKKPLIITIFLIVLIALIALYMFFANNPKTIFVQAIDSMFHTVENNIKDSKYDMVKGTGTIDFKLNSPQNEFAELNKIGLSVEYYTDFKNNIMNTTVKSTYDNEHLLDGTIYIENGKFYFSSADLLNKPIEAGAEEVTAVLDAADRQRKVCRLKNGN